MKNDWLIHQLLQLTTWEIVAIIIGIFFAGIFAVIIGRLIRKGSQITYIGSDVKPWRMEVVIGYRGSTPITDVMYSSKFVRYIYEKAKGSQARLAAMKKVTGGKI